MDTAPSSYPLQLRPKKPFEFIEKSQAKWHPSPQKQNLKMKKKTVHSLPPPPIPPPPPADHRNPGTNRSMMSKAQSYQGRIQDAWFTEPTQQMMSQIQLLSQDGQSTITERMTEDNQSVGLESHCDIQSAGPANAPRVRLPTGRLVPGQCTPAERAILEMLGELQLQVQHLTSVITQRGPFLGNSSLKMPPAPADGLPLESIQALNDFEVHLQNKIFKQKLVSKLSLVGGQTLKKTVWRICGKVFAPQLAVQLNWCGRGEKTAIKNTHLKDTIVYVQQDNSDSEEEVEHVSKEEDGEEYNPEHDESSSEEEENPEAKRETFLSKNGKITWSSAAYDQHGRHAEQNVVLDVTEGLRGHNVTCDNFFTSYELGLQLLKRKITMVGAVRKNKPELPPALLASKERKVFSSKFAFTPTTTPVSYLPKKNKNVVLLSTLHADGDISNREDRKSIIILDYNRNKGGVDNLDKVIGTDSCRRMTARWPLVIFHNIIDVSSYNAFVIWREINQTWMSRKQNKRRVFLEQLGKALVTPLIERRKHVPHTEALAAVVKAIQSAGAPDQPEDPATTATSPARASKRKRCQFCPQKKDCKTHTVCCRCKKYFCKGCALAYCPPCAN
ncbi:uncharacterized protein LOC134326079 isoform X3 [Trichomycterus rosablanca]|uniref:uncharacterized protein LOC134326079 isoform X3 n=1 Tax=Trichomycterus rosablanca TaxID=2290929 RepID=UPI002F350C13